MNGLPIQLLVLIGLLFSEGFKVQRGKRQLFRENFGRFSGGFTSSTAYYGGGTASSSFRLSKSFLQSTTRSLDSSLQKNKNRIDFASLQVNQRLKGKVVHIYEGKKGRKAYLQVGVFRPARNETGHEVTKHVNAMVRLNEEKKDDSSVAVGDTRRVYVAEVQRASARLRASFAPVEDRPRRKGPRPAFEPKLMLADLEFGQKLKGEVVRMAPYAAWLDCGVGRPGRHGALSPADAFLHVADLGPEAALAYQAVRSAGVTNVIAVGAGLEVYVKRALPRSGQLRVSLEPVDAEAIEAKRREVVRRLRNMKKRRPLSALEVGSERWAQILDVRGYGLIVDTKARRRGLVHLSSIKPVVQGLLAAAAKAEGNRAESDPFVDLTDYFETGDWIKARVSSIDDGKLAMEFVGFEPIRNKKKKASKGKLDEDQGGDQSAIEDDVEASNALAASAAAIALPKKKQKKQEEGDDDDDDDSQAADFATLFGGDDDDDDDYYDYA
uniref:S1 motif domain-containing protein n=1 Tax=Heterosigma akashiwo TaxID=2829 RepID=A0A7S3UWW6_HETAK